MAKTRTSSLLTVAMGVVTAFAATDAQAATVEKVKFKGNQVATFFFASTTIDCGDGTSAEFSANGFLSGSQQLNKTKGTPKDISNGTFVEVSFFNGCTNESGFGSGGISGGFAAPNRNLVSASIDGSTLLQDFGDGDTFPFSVEVDVVGEGPVTSGRSKTRTRTKVPFTITHSEFANANRSGTATGTISVAGVALTPEFFSTTLSFNSNSTLTITK